MSPVDEGLIHAWLDGQLPPDEAARIEALVASDPAWQDAAAEARGLLAASARILGALDDAPAVRPLASAPSVVRAPRPWYAAAWLKAAAGVVLIAGVASVTWKRTPEEVRVPTTEVAAVVPESAAVVRDVVADTSTTMPASVRVAEAPPPRESLVASPPPPPPAPTTAAAVAAPPAAQKATGDVVGAGVASDFAGRAAREATRQTVADSARRTTTTTLPRTVITAPPVPLIERGTVGSGISSFAPIPSACWYPITERGVIDSAGVVQLSALSVAQDSVVNTRWMTVDGVTVTFTGRLTGDTLSGRVRESAGDIRQLPRDLKLVRGTCRSDR